MKRKTIKRGVNLLLAAEEGKKQSILERKTHMEVSEWIKYSRRISFQRYGVPESMQKTRCI